MQRRRWWRDRRARALRKGRLPPLRRGQGRDRGGPLRARLHSHRDRRLGGSDPPPQVRGAHPGNRGKWARSVRARRRSDCPLTTPRYSGFVSYDPYNGGGLELTEGGGGRSPLAAPARPSGYLPAFTQAQKWGKDTISP